MIMKEILNKLLQKQNLTADEITKVGGLLTTGQLVPEQAAAFLMGLAMKGETVDEIVGLVKVLRSHMLSVLGLEDALDTCGTGGDGSSTLNASTMSAFVCAAAGLPVAKHGNRAISSRCGSFDLIEGLGININVTPEQAADRFKKIGITFLYAFNFHPAFKYIMPVRKALGIRTIFNFLGPLLNPGRVRYQVIGVSSGAIAEKLGPALVETGSKRVLLIHSENGLDEASIAGPTQVYEYSAEAPVKKYTIEPEQIYPLDGVLGGDPKENISRTKKILAGSGSPAENEFVAMNAGLGLYVIGKVQDFAAGKKLAHKILASGAALKKVSELVTL